jgi:pimeloyl-ACP methyl ester carboxylesterase
MGYHILLWLALTLALTAPGAAEPASVLDVGAVPHLGAEGRTDYTRFLQQSTPRAFALSPSGAWGWAAAQPDLATTEARAIALCAQWVGEGGRDEGCRVYAQDLAVVWPGREGVPAAAPARPMQGGPGWALVADGRFLWQGPQAARGAYIWAHGRAAGGQDSRGSQPQPHVRLFNNAGWDVLRFDRDPMLDETESAAGWLHGALRALRAEGYQRIVVGGQSRGAWNALQALDEPGLVDGVVAIAPAAHGPRGSPAWGWAVAELRDVLERARNPEARVAVATFEGDEYDPDPAARARLFRALTRRVKGLLFLDRPAGLAGHGGGAEPAFTDRYAPCLLDFIEGRPGQCG